MFSKLLVFEIIPNIAETVILNRKKIIRQAKKQTKAQGKGSTWGFKKRQYLSRIPIQLYKKLKYDVPEWRKAFGCLTPKNIKQIAKNLNWNDQRIHKLSKLDRILLWIFRLRKAVKFSEVALLMGVSTTTCQQIFEFVNSEFIHKFNNQIQLPFGKNQKILKNILKLRGDILPEHVYALDGKHFRRYGGKSEDHSFKTNKKAKNGLLLVNRATGKIDYMSINHCGTTHDIKAFQSCNLMQNEIIKHSFFDNYTIIADLGFQTKEKIAIYTPGYKENSDGWEKLTIEQRKAAHRLRQAQKNIENTFATIFFNTFKLTENLFGNDSRSNKQSKILLASVLLHNLTIEWSGKSIFSDPFERFQIESELDFS